MFDVIIIGAGVVGCLTARSLSRYKLRILLVDKAADVAEGSSKANSGIVHAGYDAKPHSLRALFNIKGNSMMKCLAEELSVSYRNTGSLVVAFNEEELRHLEALYQRGRENGVPSLELVTSGNRLAMLEPGLSPEARGALYAPTAGIICPYGLAIAACENAVENGVQLMLGTEVLNIEKISDQFMVHTSKGPLTASYLVNAAGLHADEISAMLEEKWFTIKPRRGEYLLMDRSKGGLVSKTLFGTPSSLGKGILVSPTVDGNLFLGPTSEEQEDKAFAETTYEGMETVLSKALKFIPGLNAKDVITAFSGIRAIPNMGDFIVKASDQVHGLIHAAGIDSPGLTASPAIAETLVELLGDEGLKLIVRKDYHPIRKPIQHFNELPEDEKSRLIKENPLYGHILCRCEGVTEAEVLEAIHRPAGATTLDGVKRRVRAGMGRCQGGFCTPGIVEVLARELQIPMEQITKKGRHSVLLMKKLKETGV